MPFPSRSWSMAYSPSTPQTVTLARPGADSNQPVQRMMTNSLSVSSVSSAPLSAPNSVPSLHAAGPVRPQGPNMHPGTQSKLAGTNGTATFKMGGFGQGLTMHSPQESSQDKHVEQAKLVS